MTDYYPLIGKAVAGLEKNTGEARRVLYERARTALVGQLRNMDPPLTESEITRERLALDEAIRKVEAEAARRLRMEPPKPDALSNVRPGEAAPSSVGSTTEQAPTQESAPRPTPQAPPPPPRRDAAPPLRHEAAAPPAPPRRDSAPPAREDQPAEPPPEAPARSGRNRLR